MSRYTSREMTRCVRKEITNNTKIDMTEGGGGDQKTEGTGRVSMDYVTSASINKI